MSFESGDYSRFFYVVLIRCTDYDNTDYTSPFPLSCLRNLFSKIVADKERTISCIHRTISCIDRTISCIERTINCIEQTVSSIERTISCTERTISCIERAICCWLSWRTVLITQRNSLGRYLENKSSENKQVNWQWFKLGISSTPTFF